MPIWPSTPGNVTMFTSSEYKAASGVTISSLMVLSICPTCCAKPSLALDTPLLALSDLLDRTFHIEVAFCHVIMFAFQDFLKTTNRFLHGNLFTLSSGEDLRHAEGLAQKALNLACTKYS